MNLFSRMILSLQGALIRNIAPRRIVVNKDIRFSLSCENPITYFRWKNSLTKEVLTLKWIDTMVGGEGVFFDIGANIGEFSVYAALRHPTLRICAFEPEYSNLNLLKGNIVANTLTERIEPYAVALTNKTGLSYLHLQDFTPGSAKHTVSKDLLARTAERCPVIWREGVCTYSLDQFCEESGIFPNYIKLDVDGNEPEILEGGIKTLSHPRLKSIIMEFSHDSTVNLSCNAMLAKTGFKLLEHHPLERLGLWVRGI